MSWTKEQLEAYLAGEASAEDVAAIEAALVSDPALEDELMMLDPLAAQLEGAVSHIVEVEAEQATAWQAALEPPMAKAGYDIRHLAAAAVFGAVISAGVWFASATEPEADWRAEVASYQALYSTETIAAIDMDEEELAAQIDSVGARVGFSNLRQLTDNIEGLYLLRGQILAHEGQALAQIVFANPDGLPIALCLIEKDGATSSEGISMAERAGLASASFETAEHSWLLIGTQDDALISATAEKVVSQLAAL